MCSPFGRRLTLPAECECDGTTAHAPDPRKAFKITLTKRPEWQTWREGLWFLAWIGRMKYTNHCTGTLPIQHVNLNGLLGKKKRKKNTRSTRLMCWNADEHHVIVPSCGREQGQHGDAERALTGVNIPLVPGHPYGRKNTPNNPRQPTKWGPQTWKRWICSQKNSAGPITQNNNKR